VHVLPPEQFRRVRRDRNRHKITDTEQERLADATVGIVGLSVGNAVARALALEGLAGRLRLADFDSLDLSNLNRLQAGVHEIGINKAIIAARQIYDTDPYAQIEVSTEGLTENNIECFLAGPPKLSILVDECDGLDMKMLMRERARLLGIPVLMETSDRGMLDVERFDLEPERPILHGRLGNLRAHDLAGLTTEQKVRHVLRILEPDELTARAAASMVEIARTITTWPQLASEVQLGGAAVATAVRRLLLGLPLPSGRRYIELESLVATPERRPAEDRPQKLEQTRACPAARSTAAAPSSFVRWLAEHAALAPSAGNCQPWRFESSAPDELVIVHDSARSRSVRDWRGLPSYIAIGAAVENACIAAASLGRSVMATTHSSSTNLPLTVTIKQADGVNTDKDEAIARLGLVRSRATDRRFGDGSALGDHELVTLKYVAEASGAHLQLVSDERGRATVGQLLGAFDRLQFTVPALHHELMNEMRWSTEEAERKRDGLDVTTLGLTPSRLAALQLLARPDVASILRSPGRGAALEEMARDALAASSAVGLLRVAEDTAEAFVDAGRVMQRLWIEGVRLGLGIQPWTALPFVARIVDLPAGDIFDHHEKAEVRCLSAALDAVFSERRDWSRAILFRVTRAATPPQQSQRRHLEDIFGSEVT
jgi:molybdopterin/thiamine biosynthesis adenylyltransferase